MDRRDDTPSGRSEALSDLALALGLVRMMTLLSLHSEALDMVEAYIAHAYELIVEGDCE